jgi:hypothetical protein
MVQDYYRSGRLLGIIRFTYHNATDSLAPHCEREATDDNEIEITSEMIEAGVAVLEDRMLEGQLLDLELRAGLREAFLAMYKVAKSKH